MKKAKKRLLSTIIVLSIIFGIFSGSELVLAEEALSVRMTINEGSEMTEYASLMEAIHAMEALIADNADNKNNTYELYFDVGLYAIDEGYVFPEVERISFVGGITDTDYSGPYYQITHIGWDGNVVFQSDVEMSNVCFIGSVESTLTGQDFYGYDLCWFGNDFYPLGSVNLENFYGYSYDTYEKLNSKNYNNLDELAKDFDVKDFGLNQLWFYCSFNADTVTCATDAIFFRGRNVTSNIGRYISICNQENIWQPDGILFSTVPPMGEDDYISVYVKDAIIKYAKTSSLYWQMGTMKHEKTRISVENITVDSATTLAEEVNLEMVMGEYDWGEDAYAQPECNLDITGQISGINNITCAYSLLGYNVEDGQDWRELMKQEWGAASFKALTISQLQEENINLGAELVFPNGSGGIYYMNLQKKGNEYWMDFEQPFHELMKLDAYDYVEKDGIYYDVTQGYVIPRFYVGDSDTMTIPSYVTLDGTEYYVYCYYGAPMSLKTNVKTIVLPEDTTHLSYLGGPIGLYYNNINAMLPGGNDNSALERFEIAGENINYSTDEEGNLYNGNKSILYCCPPAKSHYSFPDTVTKIGDCAFMGCDISDLQIPEQIEIIGEYAFRGMKQLKTVEFKGTNVIDFRGYSFYHVGSADVVINSPDNEIVKNEALLYGLTYGERSDEGGNGEDGVSGSALKGDLNKDSAVTLQDANLALRISLGIIPLMENQMEIGDVNGDGLLNLRDTVLILKRALGIIEDFEIIEDSEDIEESKDAEAKADCQNNIHAYDTIKEATFEEGGIKACIECNHEIQIGKRNQNYLFTFIEREATYYEDGYKVITDEDTGYYKGEVIMHLGYAAETN